MVRIQYVNMKNITLVFTVLVILLLSGCANFILPEVGSIARPEARIALDESGLKDTLWQTDYATLTYSISGTDDALKFSGYLEFQQRLTGTFNVMRSFFFYMSFIDEQGLVLGSVDICPRYSVANIIPSDMNIERSMTKPPGASGIVFSYYGVFGEGGGDTQDSGGGWEIYHFPFD